ncbi:hypothetical protein BO70DRAFT_361507 [Aspergillus heteromorphus CBS 117.55]|uniref:Uncharacterized protein n=1 Tax=Aspergillus heteromorphus CBS 117.55 TaxID=1448321 RepID=A0A317WA23_9EURO|nr:uncharacterized protein BO70DRAFT_361507 [Aspergillus heteromorphus CBS 117.55]PWY83384.1 hypothetical protein BO70DRAFT_361507 [Aspergillus heteromorphus CBS 117.55]
MTARVARELQVNILTRIGFHALQGILSVESGESTTFYDSSDGTPYAVRDVVHLRVWRKGQGKSTKHTFHIATDESVGLQSGCHAILGGDCVVGYVREDGDLPVAVTQLSKQSKGQSMSVGLIWEGRSQG